MAKKKRVKRTKTKKSCVKKCNFGFDLKPSCSAYNIRMNLQELPDREYFEESVKECFQPYTYRYVDSNTILIDQCLVCHMNKGITPYEYHKKNVAAGVTPELLQMIEFLPDEIVKEVNHKIKEDRKELIKHGMPIGMGLNKDIPVV